MRKPAVGLTHKRKVDVRLPGKGNPNSHGARPVHQIISTIKWILTHEHLLVNRRGKSSKTKWRPATSQPSTPPLPPRTGCEPPLSDRLEPLKVMELLELLEVLELMVSAWQRVRRPPPGPAHPRASSGARRVSGCCAPHSPGPQPEIA